MGWEWLEEYLEDHPGRSGGLRLVAFGALGVLPALGLVLGLRRLLPDYAEDLPALVYAPLAARLGRRGGALLPRRALGGAASGLLVFSAVAFVVVSLSKA